MARVNVDSSAFKDGRIKVLAKLINTDFPSALGKLCCIWEQCTELETEELPESIIDSVAETDGFADMMWRAQLSELTETRCTEIEQIRTFRVKGTKGRIEWKKSQRERSAKGGESTRKKHRARRPSVAKAKAGPIGPPQALCNQGSIPIPIPIPKYITPRFSEGDLDLATRWLGELFLGKGQLNKEKAAETLRQCREIDGFSPEELEKIFEFVRQDAFWSKNAQSPAGLRVKSKSNPDMTKIQLISSKMKDFKSKSEQQAEYEYQYPTVEEMMARRLEEDRILQERIRREEQVGE